MRERYLSFWCYALLFIVPFLKFQFFAIGQDDNLMMRQEFHLNFMEDRKMKSSNEQYLYKSYIKDNDSKTFLRTHEFFTNSMINKNIDSEQRSLDMIKKDENNSQMPIKLNEDNNKNIVPYKMCDNNITCIQLCCRLGDRLIAEKCSAENGKYLSPNVYEFITNNTLLPNKNKRLDELFQLAVHDPCQKTGHFVLNSDNYPDDEYIFLANGSLCQSHYAKFIRATSYCLVIVNREKFDVITCEVQEISRSTRDIQEYKRDREDEIESIRKLNEMKNKNERKFEFSIILIIINVLSLLFLLMTFVIYSVLPELHNIHSYMLRRYVGSMFVGGMCYLIIQLQFKNIQKFVCFTLAFITYYFLLAGYCWLNVMSFDMWKAFRKIRPLKRNAKLEKRKKIILYSIYAWGIPLILVIICGILVIICSIQFVSEHDYTNDANKDMNKIKAIFDEKKCWFKDDSAVVYYYLPMRINTISSIYLSIYTVLKIMYYEKVLTDELRHFNVRRHNNHMKWINSYLKMFIVMCIIMSINWILLIVSSLVKENEKQYILYLVYSTELMQNFYIFIIFVWKSRIKRLLQQRFGCQNYVAFPKSQQSIVTVSSDIYIRNTLQDNMNSCEQTKCHANSSFDSTDL